MLKMNRKVLRVVLEGAALHFYYVISQVAFKYLRSLNRVHWSSGSIIQLLNWSIDISLQDQSGLWATHTNK